MTKVPFTVIGAGMAGLLAAAILREECACVLEAQPSLPNNHSALLRFRTSIVGDTLNIPFRPVKVIKAVQSIGNPIADAISYSIKTNGTATLRSLISAEGKPEWRYIAPPDFIQRVRDKVSCPIEYGQEWDGRTRSPVAGAKAQTISTLPMPLLMRLLGYKHDLCFRWVHGYVATARLRDVDLCATIYIPSEAHTAYRASITGDTLIVEYAFPGRTESEGDKLMAQAAIGDASFTRNMASILRLFGMNKDRLVGVPSIKPQRYAKILPVPDDARKRFIMWASEHHNIYSFGRFATWRPGLMTDDLINDLRVIQRIAAGGTSYDARRA